MSHRWGRGRRSHVTTRTRNRIMVRDRGECQIQSPQCTGVATVVDHIQALSEGGTDEDENLQAACDACHDPKSLAEAQRGNQRRRSRGFYPAEQHPGLVD